VMEHTTKEGEAKFLSQCNLPLTGKGVVDLLITDLAVFRIDAKTGAELIELAPGVTLDEIKAKTQAPFSVAAQLKAA